MKRSALALLVTLVPAVAAADDAATARCTQGLDFAAKQDLPRASLYLEACSSASLDGDLAKQVARTRADVAHKLDNSKLSALSIITTPEGLVAETDAMPGERFTTPATIWTKAGDYKVHVALDAATLDAGKGLTSAATLDAFSRRTVIINLPKPPPAPKDGTVDFSEDVPEQTAHKGPPPKIPHVSILPKKYVRPGSPSGPLLDDPFAPGDTSHLAWRLGARIGGGIYKHAGANTGPAFSVAGTAARTLTGNIALATRVSFAHRDVDAIGLDVGFAYALARTDALVLSASAALRGEVRIQDELAMQTITRIGIGAAAGLDLALHSIPLTIGLRVEPAFTELTPGARNHNALFEVGYDWR